MTAASIKTNLYWIKSAPLFVYVVYGGVGLADICIIVKHVYQLPGRGVGGGGKERNPCRHKRLHLWDRPSCGIEVHLFGIHYYFISYLVLSWN